MTTNTATAPRYYASYQTDCDMVYAIRLEEALKAAGNTVTLEREMVSRQRWGVTIRTWATTATAEQVQGTAHGLGVPLYGICRLSTNFR